MDVILKSITYKPNIRFSIEPFPTNGFPRFKLIASVEDSRDRRQLITITLEQSITELFVSSKDMFIQFVLHRIQQFERHEIDEWFKIDGKHLHEPHAKVG